MIGRAYKASNLSELFGLPSAKRREDELIGHDYPQLLTRCSDLTRNCPIASTISNIYNEYVGNVGCQLGGTTEEVLEIWAKWSKDCTIRGDDWQTSRKIRLKEGTDSGGALVLFVYDDEQNLKLDFVHGGSLANPPKVGQGEKDSRGYRVFNGIAFDKSNKEVGFHYCVNDEWKFIHKFNSFGLHNAFYDRNALPTRAGQSRNFPLIASAIIDIEDYTTLKDYVMAGGKNAAAFGFAIESSDPASVQSGMSTVKDDGNQDFVEYVEGKANILGEVSPEFMAILPEGAKAVFPNTQGIYPFRDLLREYTMNIAAWVGLNPQILTKDISGSNFASAKFSGQSTLKTFRTWGEKLNIGDSIILKRVLFEAQISGEYNGEIEVEHQWIGDVNFDDVDSLKAANSASEKIRNNTASRTQELAKTKGSFKAIVGDAVQELKVIKQAVADNPEVTQEEIISWMTANTTEKIDIDNTTSESNDGE